MGIVHPDCVKANDKTIPKIGHDIFLPLPSENTFYKLAYSILAGQVISVRVANRKVLGGRDIESWGSEIFRHPSRTGLGAPSLLYDGYWVFFLGEKRPVRGVDHLPPSRKDKGCISTPCLALYGLF